MRSSADIDGAVDAIRAWGERCDWVGWDPYDALNSPFAGALSLGRPLGRRVLTQVVKGSPINLRPLLRIPRERDAKGIALAASAYARLAVAHADESAAAAARRLVEWLVAAAEPCRTGSGWGYHFDVQTRFFHYRRGEPNAIATTFVAHALLDARELLGDTDVDAAVLGAAAFLEGALLAPGSSPYFRYVGEERDLIHNANLLACSVLVRAARVLDEPALETAAVAPLHTTLAAQAPDGSWPYSERPRDAWVDNFHTGYVLESLAACAGLAPSVVPRLERGVAFWERVLFLADGTPRGTTTASLPVDSHSYAQAVETWLAVAPWRPDALDRAER
ncbi:MAG TPA: hypothetical protein VJ986_13135, partial [Gaiellaceae bacterium]|nr:hypothetical protein [Gaiellaceae bacterium]